MGQVINMLQVMDELEKRFIEHIGTSKGERISRLYVKASEIQDRIEEWERKNEL